MLTNNSFSFDSQDVQNLNHEFQSHKLPEEIIKIGVIYLGR